MPRKLKQQFPDGDRTEAKKAIDAVYNAESGFIVIANGDKKQIFARFHNMGMADIEQALASMEDDKKILVPDVKIIK